MNLDVALVRRPGERGLPPALTVRDRRPPHRPRERILLRIRDPTDADRLRRHGLPVFPVTGETLEVLGYPIRFPPVVVVPHELAPAVRSDLRVIRFSSRTAAARPRLEDVVVAVLSMDPIAARALVERNRDLLDLPYLAKRVYQEDLEEAATASRLHELLGIPAAGEVPPAAPVERLARANWRRGVLP